MISKNETRRIAEVIKECKQTYGRYLVDALVCIDATEWMSIEMAKLLKELNPNFDEEEFLQIISSL